MANYIAWFLQDIPDEDVSGGYDFDEIYIGNNESVLIKNCVKKILSVLNDFSVRQNKYRKHIRTITTIDDLVAAVDDFHIILERLYEKEFGKEDYDNCGTLTIQKWNPETQTCDILCGGEEDEDEDDDDDEEPENTEDD